MIINQLIPQYKTIKVKSWYRTRHTQELIGYAILRREINTLNDFSEYADDEGNIDPNKCYLRMDDGYIEVNHTFEELLNMKNRIQVKGY